MTVHSDSHAVELAATPEDVFTTLTDYERLGEWQRSLEGCRVLSRWEDGLGRQVEYRIDAKVRSVRYVLEHDYERPNRIGSRYVEGDFASMEGEWRLESIGGSRTRAELALAIDPGLPVPKPIQRKVRDRVLKRSVEDLARRMGAGPPS